MYARFSGARTEIAALVPGQSATIAGRAVAQGPQGLALRDASGLIPIATQANDINPGALVAVHGQLNAAGEAFVADSTTVLVAPLVPVALPRTLPIKALVARDQMNRTIRDFFHQQGFIEVETPNLVPSPGTDVHLEAFKTHFTGMGQVDAAHLYLHTSPEFQMKRLLVAGMEKIFQICKVYRNGEWTAAHNPEFSMIEWYRAYADYGPIMDDVEALVRRVLGGGMLEVGAVSVDLDAPFERLTVQEAFVRHANGLDILEADTAQKLRQEASARGLGELSEGGDWEDLFHELMLTHIEPHLGHQWPTFLVDYPRALAVLSRVKDDNPAVAERFELYIAGVELCNGFTELNDPIEQRARFAEDLQRRVQLGYDPYPMPEGFLSALEEGMPPSGGVAVGLDRLLMLKLGIDEIGQSLLRAVPGPPDEE